LRLAASAWESWRGRRLPLVAGRFPSGKALKKGRGCTYRRL